MRSDSFSLSYHNSLLFSSPMPATPSTPLILLDMLTLMISGKVYQIMNLCFMWFPRGFCYSVHIRSKYPLRHLVFEQRTSQENAFGFIMLLLQQRNCVVPWWVERVFAFTTSIACQTFKGNRLLKTSNQKRDRAVYKSAADKESVKTSGPTRELDKILNKDLTPLLPWFVLYFTTMKLRQGTQHTIVYSHTEMPTHCVTIPLEFKCLHFKYWLNKQSELFYLLLVKV